MEVGGLGEVVRPRLSDLNRAPHPCKQEGLPLLSGLLLSQDLFSRASLPFRMFGAGHWMQTSRVLGGD